MANATPTSAAPTTTSTVFIVDDDAAVREALVWLVKSSQLTAQAYDSAEAFLKDYNRDKAGCLVLDVRMPGVGGLELQEKLLDWNIAIPIIFITGHAQVTMAVHALKQGAFDFLEKPLDMDVLMTRIHAALAQDESTRNQRADIYEVRTRIQTLSERESQVMELIVIGRLNKQIAAELVLSQRTVEKYRANILEKMQASSTAELIHQVLQARGNTPSGSNTAGRG